MLTVKADHAPVLVEVRELRLRLSSWPSEDTADDGSLLEKMLLEDPSEDFESEDRVKEAPLSDERPAGVELGSIEEFLEIVTLSVLRMVFEVESSTGRGTGLLETVLSFDRASEEMIRVVDPLVFKFAKVDKDSADEEFVNKKAAGEADEAEDSAERPAEVLGLRDARGLEVLCEIVFRSGAEEVGCDE